MTGGAYKLFFNLGGRGRLLKGALNRVFTVVLSVNNTVSKSSGTSPISTWLIHAYGSLFTRLRL